MSLQTNELLKDINNSSVDTIILNTEEELIVFERILRWGFHCVQH